MVKIIYETIDRTDPNAREKGRQEAAAENAQLVAQLEQKLRLQEAQDKADALESVRRLNLMDANAREAEKAKNEELERKKQIKDKEEQDTLICEKLKGQLINYQFGSKLSTKAFEAASIDVSDMKRVLVALFGPTGSGKTSFIGTLERTLFGEDKQTAFEQGSGGEGTVLLQEYLSALKINLLDTRGFFNIDDNTLVECLNILIGRTRESDEVIRDEDGGQMYAAEGGRMAKFTDRVHAVIFVVQAKDRRLKEGTYLQRLQKIRDHFRFEGHSPITVITCEDELKDDEERELAFREASAATGSPMDRTFFICNYTKEKNDFSLDTEKKVLNIMDTVMMSAERFVKIQKLREKHHGSAQTTGIQEFFKRNQAANGWNADRVAAIVKQLDEMGIATVESLKESWDDITKEVKMTIGIRSGLEDALKDI